MANPSVDTRLLTFDIYQLHLNENPLGLCLTWPPNNVISTQMIWRVCDIPINDCHDDVIKWKHFPRNWPFVRGMHRSPVNSPHKGQWRGALMFTLICTRINGWVNTREAGDLRRYRPQYDVIVMNAADVLTLEVPPVLVKSHRHFFCWLNPVHNGYSKKMLVRENMSDIHDITVASDGFWCIYRCSHFQHIKGPVCTVGYYLCH